MQRRNTSTDIIKKLTGVGPSVKDLMGTEGRVKFKRIIELEASREPEMVNHPAHYGGADDPYEYIKVAKAWMTPEEYRGALLFTIGRYNMRAGKKGGEAKRLEDYRKAQFYQNELVASLSAQVKS